MDIWILCTRVQGLDPPPLCAWVCKAETPPPPYAAHVLCTQPLREKIGAKTEGGNDPSLHRSEGHSTYKGFMLAA